MLAASGCRRQGAAVENGAVEIHFHGPKDGDGRFGRIAKAFGVFHSQPCRVYARCRVIVARIGLRRCVAIAEIPCAGDYGTARCGRAIGK